MSRNGSGAYALPQPAFVTGTVISSSAMNSNLSDIAAALTQSISADGQTPITGAIKFPSGTAAAPSITFGSDSTTGIDLKAIGQLELAAGGVSVGNSTSSATTWNLNTTVSGTLGVTGATTLSSTLGVTGAVTLTSATCTVGGNQVSTSWVLLNTLTASSSSSLSDTSSFTSKYSNYAIVLQNLIPTTNGTAYTLRVHSGGAFQSTSYLSSILTWSASASFSAATGSIALSNGSSADVANSGGVGLSGVIYIKGLPTSTSITKMVSGHVVYINTGGSASGGSIAGFWNSVNAIDGIQVNPSTSTIASGTIEIFGIV